MYKRQLIYSEKSTSLIVRLKDASDTKLTVDGRSFHTFVDLNDSFCMYFFSLILV